MLPADWLQIAVALRLGMEAVDLQFAGATGPYASFSI